MADLNQLVEKARELGAAAAAPIKTSDIRFSDEFRKLCEQNSCGHYDTNWMCPPAVGSLEEVQAKVLEFSEGVVFQTVTKIADSFDFEGMMKAEEIHSETFNKLLEYLRSDMGCKEFLALNAGHCTVCKQCNFPDGDECRFPDKAVSSVEAHCIDVSALVTAHGIPYVNGPNTVSYVGLFLF